MNTLQLLRRLRMSLLLILLMAFALPAQAQDLSVALSVDKAAPLVGDEVTFTMTVTEQDGSAITANVDIPIPAGLTFVSSSSGTYAPPVDVRFNGGSLNNSSATLTFVAKVHVVTPVTVCAELAPAAAAAQAGGADLADDKACATLTPQEQYAFWMPTNADAGTVTGIDDSPAHPLGGSGPTIFVSTDGGGIYRSVDGGDNWFPTDLLDVNARAVAVSDNVDETVWAITYGNGAYRSDNMGDNFTQVFSSSIVNVAPGVAGVDNLLSLAIDNFNPVNAGGAADGDVYVGTDGDGLFVSVDDGATFVNVTFDLPGGGARIIRSIAVMNIGPPDRIFVGTHGRGVFWRDVGSTSWTEANGGLLDRAVVHALAVDGTVLYAGTNDGVYASVNGGATWTHVLDKASSGVASWDQAPVVRSLEVYDVGLTTYIVAGTDGKYVYVSDDDGATWSQEDGLQNPLTGASGLQSKTVLSLHYLDGTLYAGTQDKGVHASDDNAETFEQISDVSLQDGYRVIQDLAFHDDRLYGASYGFGVIMSDDYGSEILHWTRVNNGLDSRWINSLLSKSNTYLFAGTWGNGVYRTTDNGENWLFSGLANRIVYDLALNGAVVLAATDRGEVARSVDNGLTWQEIGVATTAITALGIDGSDIYAGTFGAGIYKSTDGGFTWVQTGMTSGHIFDFAFGTNPETLGSGMFVATSTGVYFSSDDGATWSLFQNNTGLTSTDVRSVGFAGSDLLAGTWGGGVFVYDESADAWVRDGMPGGHITVFAVDSDNGDVFVVSEGDGVYRKRFTTTTGTDSQAGELPASHRLGQNYPNPFNPSTQIEFALPEAGAVRMAVYDVLGREVRVLVDGPLTAGSHTVNFDAGNLSSGMYFYRLETAARTITRTMLLMK